MCLFVFWGLALRWNTWLYYKIETISGKIFSHCLSSDWSRPWKTFWIYYMYSDFFAVTFNFFEKVLILSYDFSHIHFYLYLQPSDFISPIFKGQENVHLLVKHFTTTQTLSSLASSATMLQQWPLFLPLFIISLLLEVSSQQINIFNYLPLKYKSKNNILIPLTSLGIVYVNQEVSSLTLRFFFFQACGKIDNDIFWNLRWAEALWTSSKFSIFLYTFHLSRRQMLVRLGPWMIIMLSR